MIGSLSRQSEVCVLGAGSWGTALALHLAKQFRSVRLWSFEQTEALSITANRENKTFLPGILLPDNISCSAALDDCLPADGLCVVAVPSHAFVETLKKIQPFANGLSALVIATKGVTQSGDFLHQHAADTLNIPVALLSGPSFAKEVALGLPSSLTLASENKELIEKLTPLIHSQKFRVEPSSDCIGVALGGLLKNVIAIAVGLSDGLGYGANARAALITRGVQEMLSITLALGGRNETVLGLAALGDLVLTTTDDQSRNRRFGLALGKGLSIQLAEEQIGQVVEGKGNVKELMMLAKRYDLTLPICEQIHQLVCQDVSAERVMDNILS